MSSWKDSWNAGMFAKEQYASKTCPQWATANARLSNPSVNPWTTCFKKYCTFAGRARRLEYWCFVLINNLVCGIIMTIAGVCAANLSRAGQCGQRDMEAFLAIGIIACAAYGLVIMLPTLSVTVRRLHDTGRSGWFIFVNIIPIIGLIVVFVTMLLDSQPGSNAYGANPKE